MRFLRNFRIKNDPKRGRFKSGKNVGLFYLKIHFNRDTRCLPPT
jgi:hypothetical protein